MKLCYQVSAEETGRTAEKIIHDNLGLSRAMVRRLKRSSGVQVNGQAVYLNTRLQEGDRLSVDLRLSKSTEVTPQPIPIDIVYEDEHLLVVSKPAGMLVHPLKHEPENTLANAVLYHYTLNGTEPVFRPLTRLDKDTSGLVILAKSAHAGYRLTQQMGTGELWREYFASAHGLLTPAQGSIERRFFFFL